MDVFAVRVTLTRTRAADDGTDDCGGGFGARFAGAFEPPLLAVAICAAGGAPFASRTRALLAAVGAVNGRFIITQISSHILTSLPSRKSECIIEMSFVN